MALVEHYKLDLQMDVSSQDRLHPAIQHACSLLDL